MILNLLLVLFTFGQTGSTDTLGRLSIVPAVDSLQVIENVYLQTDRSCYYPGEDIWFKAYLVEASDRLLTKHSGNLHVELISPASKIIRSFIAKLDDGMGNGDFKLPRS